jgi:hypothetical protein
MVKSTSFCSTPGVGRFEATKRRLAGQCPALGQPPGDELEHRIIPERVVIIAVLVPGQDAEETLPEHRVQRLPTLPNPQGIGIKQTSGHATGVTQSVVELPQRQQPGVGGEPAAMLLDNHRQLWEKIEVELLSSLHGHKAAFRVGLTLRDKSS